MTRGHCWMSGANAGLAVATLARYAVHGPPDGAEWWHVACCAGLLVLCLADYVRARREDARGEAQAVSHRRALALRRSSLLLAAVGGACEGAWHTSGCAGWWLGPAILVAALAIGAVGVLREEMGGP